MSCYFFFWFVFSYILGVCLLMKLTKFWCRNIMYAQHIFSLTIVFKLTSSHCNTISCPSYVPKTSPPPPSPVCVRFARVLLLIYSVSFMVTLLFDYLAFTLLLVQTRFTAIDIWSSEHTYFCLIWAVWGTQDWLQPLRAFTITQKYIWSLFWFFVVVVVRFKI